MSRPAFPIEVKRGSVAVKIYKTPTRGYDSFTVCYYQDGKRRRTLFGDLEVARTEAETIATRLGNVDSNVLTLTSADRAAYLRARSLLDPLGIPIEAAAVDMAEATKRLQGVPLLRAVDFYLQRHPVATAPRATSTVVEELLALKAKDGLSAEYLRQLGMALRLFSVKFPGPIEEVRGAAIDDWTRSMNWAPRTRNNLRNSLQTLFNFAKARRYVAKDHDELEAVGVAKDRDGEIEIYSPAELQEILSCAPEGLIAFLVLGAFAGIRHAEIQRLAWRDIRLADDLIEIRAAKAKTASRRTIPITPNLKAWLLPRAQKSGAVCAYQNVSNVLQDLVGTINQERAERKHAEGKGKRSVLRSVQLTPNGVVVKLMPAKVRKILGKDGMFEWKRNGLRHSFISYRVADVQDVAKVSLEAGNSPQMIFKHYRELVTPKAAKAWFQIKESEALSKLRTPIHLLAAM